MRKMAMRKPQVQKVKEPAPAPAAAETGLNRQEMAIGVRLKQLRGERKWTLERTSEQCGVSLSAVSKIERGELSPTIGTLQRIAAGFGMDVATLLTEAKPSARAAGRRSVTRGNQGQLHKTGTCDNFWLCADLAQKIMNPMYTRVRARSVEDYTEWHRHNSEIFIYVLKGTVVVHSEIYSPITLSERDSMYYDASAGHMWTSVGPQDAEVLWTYTSY
jgi:transcriptional regulator with XRE-family HTH domain